MESGLGACLQLRAGKIGVALFPVAVPCHGCCFASMSPQCCARDRPGEQSSCFLGPWMGTVMPNPAPCVCHVPAGSGTPWGPMHLIPCASCSTALHSQGRKRWLQWDKTRHCPPSCCITLNVYVSCSAFTAQKCRWLLCHAGD